MSDEYKKIHNTKPEYFIEHEQAEESKYERYDRANADLQKSLNRHLEIYANNGHALAQLTESIKDVNEKIDATNARLEEVWKPFRDAQGVARAIKWGGGMALAIVAMWGLFKTGLFAFLRNL